MKFKKLLIDFEEKVANNFNKGLIRSPVHLTYGNEDFLIKFFKKIKKKRLDILFLEIALSLLVKRGSLFASGRRDSKRQIYIFVLS